jgi:peptidoglycan/LPS O-acetylase OafA/YrhL
MAFAAAAATAAASSPWAQRLRIRPGMLMLGTASYSIYLIHSPFMSFAVRGLRHVTPGVGPLSAFLAISLAALTAGLAYFFVYERYAIVFIKRRFTANKDEDSVRNNSIEAARQES